MRFHVLGSVTVSSGHGTVRTPPGRLPLLVLARLVLADGARVSAETLMDSVWGTDVPPTARSALQMHVSAVRKAFGEDAGCLQTVQSGYRLDLQGHYLDLDEFGAHVEAGRGAVTEGDPGAAIGHLDQALALWTGEPLDGLPDTPFVGGFRTQLREERLHAVELRARAAMALGRSGEVVSALVPLVESNPFHEGLVDALARALYLVDRQADALGRIRDLRAMLLAELGLSPGPAIVDLERAILRKDPALMPGGSGGAGRRGRAGHLGDVDGRGGVSGDAGGGTATVGIDVPAPPVRLLGRDLDIIRIGELLADGLSRLITLVGPGGVGKTSLALSTSAAHAEAFPGGCRFVDLSGLRETSLVLSTIATTLGLPLEPDRPTVDTLAEALAGAPVLLVLDNLEQLPDGGLPVANLLARVPDVVVLATSRVPLQVRAERLHPVASLPVPDDGDASALDGPAAQLLVERVRAADPGFTPEGSEVALIADICRRLDGLPLAIELAASRVASHGLDEVAVGLRERFEALDWAGAIDLPSRQQTLRATVDWTVELLSAEEQQVFDHLGVFAGPFTLDALAAVVGDREVVELSLPRLLTHQLLRRQRSVEDTVLDTPETVRAHAAERLVLAGTSDQAHRRHANYRLERAERLKQLWHGPDQARLLAAFRRDAPNDRAALRWAAEEGERSLGLHLADHLLEVWTLLGAIQEAREWVQALLDLPGPVSADDEVRARNWLGHLAFPVGDLDTAEYHFRLAVARAPELDDEFRQYQAANNLAVTQNAKGSHAAAEAAFRDYVAWAHRENRTLDEAYGWNNLAAALASQQQWDEASRAFDRSHALLVELGDHERVASSCANIAWAAKEANDPATCLRRALEALDHVLLAAGEGAAPSGATDLPSTWSLTAGVLASAWSLAAFGRDNDAAALLGLHDRLFEVAPFAMDGDDLTNWEQMRDGLQERVPDWDERYRAGREMALVDGINMVRSATRSLYPKQTV